MASALESTFEPVVQTHLYPRSVIDVFVSVEHQDGGALILKKRMCPCLLILSFFSLGVLTCAINAVTLALLDAGISMIDYVVALSVGLHLQSSRTLLDLSLHEENALPHLVAATLPRSGKITLAQLETRIHANAVQEMLAVVAKACAVLHGEMDRAMHERTRRLAVAMGGGHAVSAPVQSDVEQQMKKGNDDPVEDDIMAVE